MGTGEEVRNACGALWLSARLRQDRAAGSPGESPAADGQQSHLRPANKRHHRLLGLERQRPDRRTEREFIAVAAAGVRTCALRADGTATCWGHDPYGQNEAPSGQFTALSISSIRACALQADGTLTCWGEPLTVSPPRGVEFV